MPLLRDVQSNSESHCVKVYSDAEVSSSCDGTGYGVVIVDNDNKLCEAMEMVDNAALNPLAAEVQAILHALRLLQQMDIREAQVFSDSYNTINMINKVLDKSTDVTHWIISIQDMCKRFQSISFHYISKNRNVRAYALAKKALASKSTMLWLSDFSSWLVALGKAVHCKCINTCVCLN